MITQDLDKVTNLISRELVFNHYSKDSDSKFCSQFQTKSTIGRTNSSSALGLSDCIRLDMSDIIYLLSNISFLLTNQVKIKKVQVKPSQRVVTTMIFTSQLMTKHIFQQLI